MRHTPEKLSAGFFGCARAFDDRFKKLFLWRIISSRMKQQLQRVLVCRRYGHIGSYVVLRGAARIRERVWTKACALVREWNGESCLREVGAVHSLSTPPNITRKHLPPLI
jgi:hypothetical protein